MKSKSQPQNDGWKPVALLTAIVCVLIAAKLFHLGDQLQSLEAWIKSLGPWGPVVYVLIYIVAVVAALPAIIFTGLAGVLFGTVIGVIVVNIGATVGACLAFLVGRYFARGAVEQMIGHHPNFKKLDQWTAKNGVWIVIATRLLPLLPFNLLNYAFGLTRIRFWPYAFWSWLCMIPFTIVYVAGANAVKEWLLKGEIPWALVGIIVAIVAVLVVLGPFLKKRVKL